MPNSSQAMAYLILSLLCGVLNIAPTVFHLKQGHSGPGAFGVWVVLLNVSDFTNALVWRNDAIDRAPVLCDITTKITLVGPLGLLIANCRIIRYLATIVAPHRSLEDPHRRRQRQILDYSLSFGLPCLVAGSSVLYQVARYQINRQAGCSPVSALVWPTLMLSLIWPPISCGIACGYSVYVMYWLVRRHRDLRELVEKPDTMLNLSRFVRMSALSATYLCISAPCTIIGIMATLQSIGPYVPWRGWSYLHNRDNQLTAVRQDPLYEVALRDWLPIFAGITAFLFFSFAKESFAIYAKLYRFIGVNDLMKHFCPLKTARQSSQHSAVSMNGMSDSRHTSPCSILFIPRNSTLPDSKLQPTENPISSYCKGKGRQFHHQQSLAIQVSVIKQETY